MVANIVAQQQQLPWYYNTLNRVCPARFPLPKLETKPSEPLIRAVQPISLSHMTTLTKEAFNSQWNNLLQDVQKALQNQPGEHLTEQTKQELQKLFEHLSLDHLQKFLEQLPEWHLSHADIPLSNLALEAIPIDKMEEILKKQYPDDYTTISDFAGQLAKCLPPVAPEEQGDVPSQEVANKNAIATFFYSFARIFIQSFNIFDSPRPPDTIYEYHVLTSIYFNFLKIPVVLVIALAAFMTPVKVLITTVLLLGLAVAAIYSYMKWFKPCPHEVWYCNTKENLKVPPVFCHEQELKAALNFLGQGTQNSSRSIVFIGEPGVGKTHALMYSLAASLKKKRVFAIDPARLFGSSSMQMSTMEKITMAFREVRGFEDQVVFLLDEAGDAFNSKFDDMVPLFKLLKDNYPKIQILATMTDEQWKKVIAQDPALKDRFKPFHAKETNDVETLRIIEDEAKRNYPYVPITRDGFEAIVKISTERKQGAQPRQALFALEEIAKDVETINLIKTELSQAEHVLANMKTLIEKPNSPLNNPYSLKHKAHLQAIAKQEERVTTLKEEQEKANLLQRTILQTLDLDRYYLQQRNEAVRQLSVNPPISDAEKIQWQKRLMFTNFFAFQQIKRMLDAFAAKSKDLVIPLIDETYVAKKMEK